MAAGRHSHHPGEPPQHSPLLGHAAGPGGRPDPCPGVHHRPAASLRPGRRDISARRDRGARSGGAGAAAGGAAAAALRSAQPRCGGGDGGARRQRPAGEAPGALPGLALHPSPRIRAAHPRRRGGGGGAGPGPAGSGPGAPTAAAGPGAAAGIGGGEPAGGAFAGGGGHPAGTERAAGRAGRSGLHRKPGTDLAGGVGPAGGAGHGPGAHRSQPAGAGPPPPLRGRRLRCGGRGAPASLGGVGGAGRSCARWESAAQPGPARAAAPPMAPPASGIAAPGGWGLEPAGATGRGLLGPPGPRPQPLVVALQAPARSTLSGGFRGSGSDAAGGHGLPRLRRQAGGRSPGGGPGPVGGDGDGGGTFPSGPGP